MKIEITINIKKKEVIDVELPYYYKQDLFLDDGYSIIYGKIEEDKCTAIQISKSFRGNSSTYELEVEVAKPASSSCYFDDKYKSSETEYLEAKANLIEAAGGI